MPTTREALPRTLGARPLDPQAELLQVLAEGVPLPLLLLDEGGRLVWFTGAARERFARDAGPGLERMRARRHALEALGARVRDAARAAPAQAAFRCTIAGEALAVRRHEASTGRALYLATCTGAPGPRASGAGSIPDVTARARRLTRALGLTRPQRQVLAEVARGRSNREIGALLGCTVVVVERHVEALRAKLGCANRAELVARFWTA